MSRVLVVGRQLADCVLREDFISLLRKRVEKSACAETLGYAPRTMLQEGLKLLLKQNGENLIA